MTNDKKLKKSVDNDISEDVDYFSEVNIMDNFKSSEGRSAIERKATAQRNVIVLSKVMSIVFFVLFILCCVGAGCCFILWFSSFFVDYSWLRDMIHEYGHVATSEIEKINLLHAQYVSLVGLFSSGGAGVAMIFLRNAFRQITIDKTPFSQLVIKKMIAAGIASLAVCIFIPLSTGITSSICNAIDTSSEFSAAGSWWMLVFGLTIFVLTFILKYGAELQAESDATL